MRERGNGEPVSFVTVIARAPGGRRGSTATDGEGAFRLPALRPGRYQVIARWGDQEVVADDVTVRAGAVTALTLALALEPAPAVAALAPGVPLEPRPDAPPVPAASAASGGIRGLVRDKVTSDFLPGAVVAASTPGVRDAVLSMADDRGRFRMPSLPPGLYTLSAYYQVIGRGAIEVRRSNVRVVAGEITVIDLDLDAQPEP